MQALSAQEFAVVLAHVGHFGSEHREEVLARLQVPLGDFLAAAEAVPTAILREVNAGQSHAADSFQDAFGGCRKKLADQKPVLSDLLPLRGPLAGPDEVTLDPKSASARKVGMPFVAKGQGRAPARLPVVPNPDAGDTIGLGETHAAAGLPFDQATFDSWTVERYAQFTAERRVLDPEQVRAAYGVRDAGTEHGLLVHMNRRFGRDPQLAERWRDLVQQRLRELGRG